MKKVQSGLLFDTGARAVFSPCRKYRYHLAPCWGLSTKRCAFLMVNPSDADEEDNDPTIRSCIRIARGWGFGAIDVFNLFAMVSAHPTDLLDAEDPIGPENDRYLLGAAQNERLVLAWGRHEKVTTLIQLRASIVLALLKITIDERRQPCAIGHLGQNADGSPKHPLFLPANTAFVRGLPTTSA